MIEEVQILTQKVYGKKAFNTGEFRARYFIFPESATPLPKWKSHYHTYFLIKAFLRIREVNVQLNIRDSTKVMMNFTTAGRLYPNNQY